MKHLIVGGDSLLGRQIGTELESRGIQFDKTSRRLQSIEAGLIEFDLNQPRINFETAYEAVYFLAGETSTRYCEENRVESHRLNYLNTLTALKTFQKESTRIVFPSSNHVFSGLTPFVPAGFEESPQSYYGLLKRSVEKTLISDFNNFSIIRLTKVLPDSFKVLDEWLKLITLGHNVEVQKDVLISPVSVKMAAQALVNACHLPARSLVQLSGPDEISYADIYDIFSKKLSPKIHPKINYLRRAEGKLHGSMELHGVIQNSCFNLTPSRELISDIVRRMDFTSIDGKLDKS